jgi:hypothetical protein
MPAGHTVALLVWSDRGKVKSDLAVAFYFETLAETVGFVLSSETHMYAGFEAVRAEYLPFLIPLPALVKSGRY